MRRNLGASELRTLARRNGGTGICGSLSGLALPLALAGALLYLVGMWSPWLYDDTTVTGRFGSGATSAGVTSGTTATFTSLLVLIHPLPAPDRLVFGWFGWLGVLALVWDALPLIGIVVCLALWAQRGASRVLLGMYTGWLVFASAIIGAGIYGTFAMLAGDHCVGGCATATFIVHARVAWGIWLTLGALASGWGAFLALTRRLTHARGDGAAVAHAATGTLARPRTRLALVGAAAFTLGVAIWALGLLLVPWVTAGCSGIQVSWTHFVRGTCTGLDGYDVLSAGIGNGAGDAFNAAISRPGLDPYHIILLLSCAGVVLTGLVWWRPGRGERGARARADRFVIHVGATCWALLIALECAAGWVGVTYRLGHQGILTFVGAPQVVGPGLWLCVAGIVLVAVGTATDWIGAGARAQDG